MHLLTVALPLLNFLLFAMASNYVNRKQLAAYTITSMGFLLVLLLTLAPSIMAGEAYTTSMGV